MWLPFIPHPSYREIELRENLVGTGFINPPDEKSEYNNRVTVVGISISLNPINHLNTTGEIVSANGFEAPKQYLFYEAFLPEGWSFEDYNEYETYGLVREETTEFNKRKSCTHIAEANVETTEDTEDPEGTEYVSHFCFPFDYQFLAKEDSSTLLTCILTHFI